MNSLISSLLQTEFGRRIELQLLSDLVTSALRLPRQCLLLQPSAQGLDAFAAFTARHLAACNAEQQHALHARALRLGRRLRKCLTRRDDEALTQLIFLLYRNIGIRMEGHFPGEVLVRRCHFCRYYSPHLCSIASLMDSGVICGLFGARELVFTERLTEGCKQCNCHLKP